MPAQQKRMDCVPWTRRVRNSRAAAAWVSSAVSQNHTLNLVWISSPPPPSDSLFGHTDVCAGLREASVAVGMRGSGHGEEDGGGQGESPSDAGVHSL